MRPPRKRFRKRLRGYQMARKHRNPVSIRGSKSTSRNLQGLPLPFARFRPLPKRPRHSYAPTPGVVSAVNPFTYSSDSGDAVMRELADLKHGLQPASPVLHGVINLLDFKTASGQTAYDRMQQLSGEIKIQGKTLRQTLGDLIAHKDYKKLPKAAEIDGYDSPRLSAVRRVINAYRRASEAQLQQEIPALREAVGAYHEDRIKLRRGERAQQLQALLNK